MRNMLGVWNIFYLVEAKESLQSSWPSSDWLPADPALVPLPPLHLPRLLVPGIAPVAYDVTLPALLQSHGRPYLLRAHWAIEPPTGFSW